MFRYLLNAILLNIYVKLKLIKKLILKIFDCPVCYKSFTHNIKKQKR